MVKVLIGNLPSTANINNNQVVQAIEGLGVKIRSPITPEFHKDPESHASLGVKTGRLIIYIDEPDNPLPEFVNIGERKASIYYFGQKREYAKGSVNIMNTVKNHASKGKTDNEKIEKKPNDAQKKEEKRKVLEELRAFSEKILPKPTENVFFTLPNSPSFIPPSAPQVISDRDPKIPRLYHVSKHSRTRGGRTQSVSGRSEKKRLPSGELDKSPKAAKLVPKNVDSDSDNEHAGNPPSDSENYDWFQNPSNGLNDNTNGGV